jgi:hypothetical protein
MKMTRAQALLVLEEEDGATANEMKQAYKKLALKWYTSLFNVLVPQLAITIFRLLMLLRSQANFSDTGYLVMGIQFCPVEAKHNCSRGEV